MPEILYWALPHLVQVLVLTDKVTCSGRIAALTSTCRGDGVPLNVVNICIGLLNMYFESFTWSQSHVLTKYKTVCTSFMHIPSGRTSFREFLMENLKAWQQILLYSSKLVSMMEPVDSSLGLVSNLHYKAFVRMYEVMLNVKLLIGTLHLNLPQPLLQLTKVALMKTRC